MAAPVTQRVPKKLPLRAIAERACQSLVLAGAIALGVFGTDKAHPTEVALAAHEAAEINLPDKLSFLFEHWRYKVAYGGRGGAKSWGFAQALLVQAGERKLRILCARELQVSIKDSVHRLLTDIIDATPALSRIYEYTDKAIICTATGSEFLFAGVRNNVTKIKSMEGIDICWVEEAETVSERSWEVLIPTIRKLGSEIWVSFNPDLATDPTYKRFVINAGALGKQAKVVEINWRDNPWFPEALALEKDYLASVDMDAYNHVWEGKCRINSQAQVLKGKYVSESFVPEPDWAGPYYGADWGYSVDPSCLVKMYIHDMCLYIYEEAWEVGCDLDDTPALFDGVEGARKAGHIRCDSARPETISYMRRHGYSGCEPAEKWPGSVEDGLMFLRSFRKIIIHPRCKHALEEARLWSYKLDKLTSLPTTDLLDAHNHIWDAVRYALEPIIKQSHLGLLHFLKERLGEKAVTKDEQKEAEHGLLSLMKAQ